MNVTHCQTKTTQQLASALCSYINVTQLQPETPQQKAKHCSMQLQKCHAPLGRGIPAKSRILRHGRIQHQRCRPRQRRCRRIVGRHDRSVGRSPPAPRKPFVGGGYVSAIDKFHSDINLLLPASLYEGHVWSMWIGLAPLRGHPLGQTGLYSWSSSIFFLSFQSALWSDGRP
jgi:hypothetical protein